MPALTKRFGLGLIAAVYFIAFSSLTARAATINVPADQPTIQAAIDAASNGDTIVVAPGTYHENINFEGKAITVTSSGGPSVTTINGGGAGAVVVFDTKEGRSSVLSGFTITNGNAYNYAQPYYDGGGISISNASPTISGNVITGNVACAEGGGIAAISSSALIEGNTITKNGEGDGCSGGGGGGIWVNGGSVEITQNTICGNTWSSGDGGGILLNAAGATTIENNTISGNTAMGISPASQGGGIDIINDTDALVVQNLIINNNAGQIGNSTGGQGGGIAFLVPSGSRGPYLINNTIANNQGAGGSAVYADGFDSQTQLINDLIVGSPGQPALYCDSLYSTTPPIIQYDDAFSPNGSGFDGTCAGVAGNNGNISSDPLFLDSGSNFHVQFGSPAIDAGDNNAPSLPSTDMDGNLRIANNIVDMGVYEFTPTTVSVSPTSLTFGPQPVATTSSPQGVTLTNTGQQELFLSISVDANFTETNNCDSEVAPGANCTVEVSFSPTTTGSVTGNLKLRDNASGSPQTLTLSGVGGSPSVSLTATRLTFDSQEVGTTSSAQQVNLSNTGDVSLAISNITTTGDFAETDNCGTSVPAGGSCSISVTFTPTAGGTRTGSVTITDDASDSPQTASLTGDGLDFSVSATPSSVTVTTGEKVQYTVIVSEVGGSFNYSVNLGCSDLPAGSVCQFTSTSLTPGTGTASTGLSIKTRKGKNGTPPGTYTVIVTGTSGSLTHGSALTLIVN